MPEFHLRRKKKGKEYRRRHTLHSSSDQRHQLQRALDMYEEHNEIILGPNEVSVDEAVAGRRGNVIQNTTSSSEPTFKANIVRKISSKYSECLYLRYGTEMRRCPMPSPITLTTVKQLFVNLFDLSPATVSDPAWHLFILDRANTWKPLELVNSVYDHCTILLVDSSDVGTLIPSPVSLDMRPSRCSTATPDYELTTPSPRYMYVYATIHAPTLVSRIQFFIGILCVCRPLSWNESLPEVFTRPKSLDISLLPSVSGEDVDIAAHSNSGHFSPLSIHSTCNEVFHPEILKRHSFVIPSKSTGVGLHMLGLYNRVQHLKHDLTVAREEHKKKMSELNLQLEMSKERLMAAVKGVHVTCDVAKQSNFRHERIALDKVKQNYTETSRKTQHNLSLLQFVIEELRTDAVNRRRKVDNDEVEALLAELTGHLNTFENLRSRYSSFETKLKSIMKEELKVIVEEETLVQEEPNRLDESIDLCSQLLETLQTLKQVSSAQKRLSPHVPIFSAVVEPDRRALMLSIRNIIPDHSKRAESIEIAENVQQKRKMDLSPSRRALKEFERSLKERQKNLKATHHLEIIENQRENKIKSFYMDEKIKRQQELEKELQIKEEMKKKKKQKEMDIIKAKLKMEEERLKLEEEIQREEMKKMKAEKEKLEMERKRNEEERKRLEELKQQKEEEQRKVDELKQQQLKEEEEARQKKEEERLKQLEEDIRMRIEKEKAEESRKERLQQVEDMLRVEIEKEKAEQRKKFEEEQRLLEELLSSDSPRLKAKRRDHLWKQIQEKAQVELEEERRKTEKTNQLRSQQMVMDSLTTTGGSTPTIYRKASPPAKASEYSNGFMSHRSNPYLPQENGFVSDYNLKRFQHLDATSSFPSDPIHRKLAPSLSSDWKNKQEPSYDTLEKLFKSEENMTQNHYDLPWNSKKLGGVVQRRGTLDNISPGNHRRNKSEGLSDATVNRQNYGEERQNLTPSPSFHRNYPPTSHTPPPRNPLESSLTFNSLKNPVYDDVTQSHGQVSPTSNGLSSPPLNGSNSINGHLLMYPKNGILPSYSQVISSNQRNVSSSPAGGHRQRSQTTNARITHYPLSTNPQKHVKPSISYV